jgi:hypothetical protein
MDVPVPVENRAGLPDERFAELARFVGRHRSIKHALDWLLRQDPPLALDDMVTQDEFSHDFLANLGDCWLAYDTT